MFMCGLGKSFKAKQEDHEFVASERDRIQRRIQSLRSKQRNVGPFRQAGIQLSIDSFKAELKKLEKSCQH